MDANLGGAGQGDEGQQFVAAEGTRHKDTAVEPFNNFIASGDSWSPSESDGEEMSRQSCVSILAIGEHVYPPV